MKHDDDDDDADADRTTRMTTKAMVSGLADLTLIHNINMVVILFCCVELAIKEQQLCFAIIVAAFSNLVASKHSSKSDRHFKGTNKSNTLSTCYLYRWQHVWYWMDLIIAIASTLIEVPLFTASHVGSFAFSAPHIGTHRHAILTAANRLHLAMLRRSVPSELCRAQHRTQHLHACASLDLSG
eukprot:3364953-Amphidinium_carterae.2